MRGNEPKNFRKARDMGGFQVQNDARLAQWTERMASDHEVRGSSPLAGTVPGVVAFPAGRLAELVDAHV